MANINKYGSSRTPTFTAAYGNATRLSYSLKTAANGALPNSDVAAPIGAGDVVRLGTLQAGLRLVDALMIVSVVLAGTAKVGFAYIDGVDSVAVPQKDDYFSAALALAALGRTRLNNNASAPIILPKDAYLIVTPAAAQTAAGQLDIVVEAEWIGNINT